MKQYLELIKDVLETGQSRDDRTNTGTISKFGTQSVYDLREGFPLLTTKKVYFRAIVHEMLWFIKGDTNIKYLVDNNVNIWNEWPFEIYRKSADYQNETLEQYVEKIRTDELFAKKHGWNPAEVDNMALPPCHSLFQLYVTPNGELDLQLYQRSGDLFLGVPFNIASYSLLLTLIALECNLTPRYFIHTIGDAHIYKNHLDQVKLQLTRQPLLLPQLEIDFTNKTIYDVTFDDIKLKNYQSHEAIKGRVAV